MIKVIAMAFALDGVSAQDFELLAANAECGGDGASHEESLSAGSTLTLEECQAACLERSACQYIAYSAAYQSCDWQYTTSCESLGQQSSGNGFALYQWTSPATTTTSTSLHQRSAQDFELLAANAECGGDGAAHEESLSAGSTLTLEECQAACLERSACQYIAYSAQYQSCDWQYTTSCESLGQQSSGNGFALYQWTSPAATTTSTTSQAATTTSTTSQAATTTSTTSQAATTSTSLADGSNGLSGFTDAVINGAESASFSGLVIAAIACRLA